MPPGGGAIRVLNVAEKLSVTKAVAEILSHGGIQSRAGQSRYNRVFEFNYAIGAQACHMLVTSIRGHLMELDFDDRYPKWYSYDPVELFHAPSSAKPSPRSFRRNVSGEERNVQANFRIAFLDFCTRHIWLFNSQNSSAAASTRRKRPSYPATVVAKIN